MIKTESLVINSTSFIRTYSDLDRKVERDGVLYDEAIDPVDSGRTYTESTEMIDTEEDVTESEIIEELEKIL